MNSEIRQRAEVVFSITRNGGETWLECCERYSRPHELSREIRTAFTRNKRCGMRNELAALRACMDWGVCDGSTRVATMEKE